jgi:hypothetical protein
MILLNSYTHNTLYQFITLVKWLKFILWYEALLIKIVVTGEQGLYFSSCFCNLMTRDFDAFRLNCCYIISGS